MKVFAIDTETTGVDFYHGARPFFITTCNTDGENIDYVWDVNPVDRRVLVNVSELRELVASIENADSLILQNAKFDYQALYLTCQDYGIELNWPWSRTEDTLIASHLLASGYKHDLTSLAIQYLGVRIEDVEKSMEDVVQSCRRKVRSKKNNLTHWMIATRGLECMPSAKSSGRDDDKFWKYDTWLPVALAKHWGYDKNHEWYHVTKNYADTDSAITLALWQVLKDEIHKRGLWNIYKERMRLVEVASNIQIRGISRSRKRSTQLLESYRQEADRAESKCIEIAEKYNYDLDMPKGNSNRSLSHFLFEVLKLPVVEITDGGNPSLNASTIDTYLDTLTSEDQLQFIRNLYNRNKLMKSIQALEGYDRYGIIHPKKKNYDILHPSLNPTATVTLRWGGQNPNPQNICFDGHTEVLTTTGWVLAEQLTDQHMVAQYWKDTGEIDFTKPEVHKVNYLGDMVHITTEQQIDLLLTPQHRCLIKNRKTKKFVDIAAEDFKDDYLHLHAGKYVSGLKNLSDDLVVVLCAVQADGSYQITDNKEYGIRITLRKKRKIERIIRTLDKLGCKYSVKNNELKQLTTIYMKFDCKVTQCVKELLPNKRFNSNLLEYNYDTLKKISEEVFFWDGESKRNSMYSSRDKENTDWIQIVMTLTNKRSNLISRYVHTSWSNKLHHFLNVTKRNYSLTTNHEKRKIPWNNYVYCVTVPSSYIIVRRDGKVSVTGNSKGGNIEWKSKIGVHTDDIDKLTLRHCFGPLPGREWYSMDYQNIELRIPAFEAGEEELIRVFLHPNDPPYFGSYHLVIFDVLHPELFKEYGVECKNKFKSTWYQWVKNGNFAIQYGAQKEKADQTYRVDGAYDLIKNRFPKIAKLNKKMMAMANSKGYVTTIPDRSIDSNQGYPIMVSRTEWGRVSPTTPLCYHVQSTAMQCTARAMVRCHDQLECWYIKEKLDAFITMQVHDELVFDFPKGDNTLKVLELQRLMEKSGDDIGVPTPVGVEYHDSSWGESKKM